MRGLFSKRLPVLAVLAVVLVGLATSAPVSAGGNQRPLADWLQNQGDRSEFFPPVPDLLGQGNTDDPPRQPARFSLVDYAGVFARWIYDNGGPALPTTVSGTVTERPLADGRAEVTVNLHTRGALTTVWDSCSADPTCPNGWPGPVLFGRTAQEVAAGAQDYALGDVDMELKFINTAPGAPLPNLVWLFGNYCWLGGPEDCPPANIGVLEWRFSARATGPLHAADPAAVAPGNLFPEGARGRFMTSQTGLAQPGAEPINCSKVTGPGPTRDCFPIESMFLEVLGNGK